MKMIYCVEFLGTDGCYYQETQWHTSRKICEDYVEKYGNERKLRVNWANLIIDENEQL